MRDEDTIQPRIELSTAYSLSDAKATIKSKSMIALQWATMVAMAGGNLPRDLVRRVEEVTEPKIPWQRVIEQFLNDVLRDDYDMMKQDRRFLQQGIYLPDLQNNAAIVSVVVDTSGSIGQEELKAFANEVRGILLARGVSKMRLMTCDAAVHLDVMLTPQDPLPDNFPGGGGTDFREPFRRLEQDMADRPAVIIYFTDGAGIYPDSDEGFATVWAIARHLWKRAFDADCLERAPFGTTVLIDLAILGART